MKEQEWQKKYAKRMNKRKRKSIYSLKFILEISQTRNRL